jgi:catechol 2,3-dioxygenase-like lactoylglutathione lyase family enzyme
MLGHLGVNVPDLTAAKAYYGALMPRFGFDLYLDHADEFAFGPAGGKPGTYLFFYPAVDTTPADPGRTGLQHLAFMVPTRSAVDSAYDEAVRLDSAVLHTPQVFPQYPQPYYAAFWLDPFGLKLEAVCHHDRA